MILADNTIHRSSKTDNDVSQNTIIHIHTSLPYDLICINAERISLLDMVVKHSR